MSFTSFISNAGFLVLSVPVIHGPNYQALFGTSLDPETKMRGGASTELGAPAYHI